MIIILLITLILARIIYDIFHLSYRIYYKIKISYLIEGINNSQDLLYMHYKDFVNVVAEMYRRKGYRVNFTDKCGEDGNGIILDDSLYVEAWKLSLNHHMDVETAMKLSIRMQRNSIYRGILITLGDFKESTLRFSHRNVIECISCNQLVSMCKDVQKRKEAPELL